jgi:hypothetical protein
VNTELPGFVAAGGNHAPVAGTSDYQRPAFQPGIFQAFHRNKESVQVKMSYMTMWIKKHIIRIN